MSKLKKIKNKAKLTTNSLDISIQEKIESIQKQINKIQQGNFYSEQTNNDLAKIWIDLNKLSELTNSEAEALYIWKQIWGLKPQTLFSFPIIIWDEKWKINNDAKFECYIPETNLYNVLEFMSCSDDLQAIDSFQEKIQKGWMTSHDIQEYKKRLLNVQDKVSDYLISRVRWKKQKYFNLKNANLEKIQQLEIRDLFRLINRITWATIDITWNIYKSKVDKLLKKNNKEKKKI